MSTALRKIAFFIGIGLLGISMFWSQDGFNFDMAGDSGYKEMAIFFGWFLAIAVSTIQFVFSSEFDDLNPSLIVFGILAYAYSIYTNYQGIIHFQGLAQSKMGATVLAVIMDAVPEPLIAWGLYESQAGDFIGNVIKSIMSAPNRIQSRNKSNNQPKHIFNNENTPKSPQFRPSNPNLSKNFGKSGDFENLLHGVKSKKHSRFE